MAAKVKVGAAPYTAGYAKLTANPHVQSGCTALPGPSCTGEWNCPRSTWPQNYGTTDSRQEFCVTRLDTSNVHIP